MTCATQGCPLQKLSVSVGSRSLCPELCPAVAPLSTSQQARSQPNEQQQPPVPFANKRLRNTVLFHSSLSRPQWANFSLSKVSPEPCNTQNSIHFCLNVVSGNVSESLGNGPMTNVCSVSRCQVVWLRALTWFFQFPLP